MQVPRITFQNSALDLYKDAETICETLKVSLNYKVFSVIIFNGFSNRACATKDRTDR
jgi:hypothetical protein